MKGETEEYLLSIFTKAQQEVLELLRKRLSCNIAVKLEVHQGGIRRTRIVVEKPL